MIFQQLKEGRSFILRFEHEEDLLEGLKIFVEENKLQGAVFWILGALGKGKIVGGPRHNTAPPEPIFVSFEDTREIIGWGNICRLTNKSPKIHLHLSAGRGENTYTGCLRSDGKVFLTCEVYLREILNFPLRKKDQTWQVELLDITGNRDS